ncbi:hypothetical protein Acsp04_31430 [Actinomadura sp. NBRC 104425]|uniref:hypothetical protein n=1 Tax=Actinomadura sp. NBRC 104425 TaxID=3032204 RepID=UPI0024A4F029|nr:hypothetical protein [Actinomadura sp. NBRC 104425]GLZ12908.1 hypothetical protein Acsp04_31430 [Actinomadura sp. NBRC 104425]
MNRNARSVRGVGDGLRDLVDRAVLTVITAVLFPHPHGWLRRLAVHWRDLGRAGVPPTDPREEETAAPPRRRLELVPPPPDHAGAARGSRATPPRPRLRVVPKPGTPPERPVHAPTTRR